MKSFCLTDKKIKNKLDDLEEGGERERKEGLSPDQKLRYCNSFFMDNVFCKKQKHTLVFIWLGFLKLLFFVLEIPTLCIEQ